MTKKTTDAQLADMADEIARSERRALRKELDELRGIVDDLRTVPADPSIVPRLISREAFGAGEELLLEHRNLAVRLRRLEEERRVIDERWTRSSHELRRDRPLPLAQDREAEIREHRAALNEQLGAKAAEISEVEAELDRVENELRDYTVIRTVPLRISRDLEIQR